MRARKYAAYTQRYELLLYRSGGGDPDGRVPAFLPAGQHAPVA